MRITPNFQTNYTNYGKKCARPQNFQGALNNAETQRVLKMLSDKNTGFVVSYMEPATIQSTLQHLYHKHFEAAGKGIFVVGPDDLPKFVKGKFAGIADLKDKIGICMAVGDKYGPIETWTKVFEAKTLLVPKNSIK